MAAAESGDVFRALAQFDQFGPSVSTIFSSSVDGLYVNHTSDCVSCQGFDELPIYTVIGSGPTLPSSEEILIFKHNVTFPSDAENPTATANAIVHPNDGQLLFGEMDTTIFNGHEVQTYRLIKNRRMRFAADGPYIYADHGALFVFHTYASADVIAYSGRDLPPGLTIDPVTGAICGIPSVTGTFHASLTASNGSKDITIQTHFIVGEAAAGMDAEGLLWRIGNKTPWERMVTEEGVDGDVTLVDHYGSSSMKTVIEGPTTLQFRWKASNDLYQSSFNDSYYSYHNLDFVLNGRTVASIDRGEAWEEVVYELPPGVHEIQFRYRKWVGRAKPDTHAMIDALSGVTFPEPVFNEINDDDCEISFKCGRGAVYSILCSANLSRWIPLGGRMIGTNEWLKVNAPNIDANCSFFSVIRLPEKRFLPSE